MSTESFKNSILPLFLPLWSIMQAMVYFIEYVNMQTFVAWLFIFSKLKQSFLKGWGMFKRLRRLTRPIYLKNLITWHDLQGPFPRLQRQQMIIGKRSLIRGPDYKLDRELEGWVFAGLLILLAGLCSSCLGVTHAHVCAPVHPLIPQEDLGRIVSLVCDQYPTWGKKT